MTLWFKTLGLSMTERTLIDSGDFDLAEMTLMADLWRDQQMPPTHILREGVDTIGFHSKAMALGATNPRAGHGFKMLFM
jgi:hypothetical protein